MQLGSWKATPWLFCVSLIPQIWAGYQAWPGAAALQCTNVYAEPGGCGSAPRGADDVANFPKTEQWFLCDSEERRLPESPRKVEKIEEPGLRPDSRRTRRSVNGQGNCFPGRVNVSGELSFLDRLGAMLKPWPGIPIALLVILASLGAIVGGEKLLEQYCSCPW